MARDEKPYRVYRGGRAKGKVPKVSPTPPRVQRRGAEAKSGEAVEYRGPGAPAEPKRTRWGLRIGIGLGAVLVLLVLWGVTSWLAFSSGVAKANKQLDQNAKLTLAPQSGLLLSHSTTILMLGTDHAPGVGRTGDFHSDSIMLLRTDPSHHRLYYLSIPRDIQVPIPGAGTQKVNAAFQIGGPALAIRAIRQFTGIPVNHVMVVNFADFKDLIDSLGGIEVTVPKPIRSNRFDCPFATQARCDKWQGWRFRAGRQHMNGERALIYSRVRENLLDPSENDVTRGARQQDVMNAVAHKFTSFGVLVRMPFSGSSFAKPLTTDLTASQLAQLGWVRFRASDSGSVHCRLGGDLGGGGTGSPSEDNPATIAMFLGRSAPQPPTDPFGPGCVIGHALDK
jgi:polyisoprenyl-teichoic acid--peptidoglycan teichoic acid transferase